MSLETFSSYAAGAFFGGVLTLSGVYKPEVIRNQMSLRDFHMVEVFLSAAGFSA